VPSIASPKFTRASFSATEVYSGVRNQFIAPVCRIHPTLKSKRVLVIRHTFSVQRHVPQYAISLCSFHPE
jgi:hypothetical protein